jgi:diaminohydroxyphosphoribosylaminopyrimidine deaminase / 5-amino-6-(5-phosphoribosylamino)uracil reductase
MTEALRLARRAYGLSSPNPMVGAVLVKADRIIGRGWHRRAGGPHGEIEALNDAKERGNDLAGATLYVTLEPCSTFGRTPPCTDAIIGAGVRRVVIGATDPNPKHCGNGITLLKRAGITVTSGILEPECSRLNETFNHWIVHRRPFVTVKTAMTLDGKIATPRGNSKWITGQKARQHGMRLRQGADAILCGINTILFDNPRLTFRCGDRKLSDQKRLRRIVLDSFARTPLRARIVCDSCVDRTAIVVSESAPQKRVQALAKRVRVIVAPPAAAKGINVSWLLDTLGKEEVTSLLVEGGGEVNASFLVPALAQRVAFFYAPKVLGGRDARRAVAGEGAASLEEGLDLTEVEWANFGPDLFMTARLAARASSGTPH